MKKRKLYRAWSDADVKELVKLWPDHTADVVAKRIKRSSFDVYAKVRHLKSVGLRMPVKPRGTGKRSLVAQLVRIGIMKEV